MPIVWTDDPAANRLLESDPLALLIGLVLDQQVKMEKAFAGPYELKRRLGHLEVIERGMAELLVHLEEMRGPRASRCRS